MRTAWGVGLTAGAQRNTPRNLNDDSQCCPGEYQVGIYSNVGHAVAVAALAAPIVHHSLMTLVQLALA